MAIKNKRMTEFSLFTPPAEVEELKADAALHTIELTEALEEAALSFDEEQFSSALAALEEMRPVVEYFRSTKKRCYRDMIKNFDATASLSEEWNKRKAQAEKDALEQIKQQLGHTSPSSEDYLVLLGRLWDLDLVEYSRWACRATPDIEDADPPERCALTVIVEAITRYPLHAPNNVRPVPCSELPGVDRIADVAVIPLAVAKIYQALDTEMISETCAALVASAQSVLLGTAPLPAIMLLFSGLDVLLAPLSETPPQFTIVLSQLQARLLDGICVDIGLEERMQSFSERLELAGMSTDPADVTAALDADVVALMDRLVPISVKLKMYLPPQAFYHILGTVLGTMVLQRVCASILSLRDISIATSEILHQFISSTLQEYVVNIGFVSKADRKEHLAAYDKLLMVSCLLSMSLAEIRAYWASPAPKLLTAVELARVVRMVFSASDNRDAAVAEIMETGG